ncbi:hypothetical protein [Solemya velesiana gill symbiont]|uniref:Zinc resistance-associated protein n=1 Tax=Solemya velesiana gill symbiont TaxID=1918948 RepID=A0A1T2KXJ3_9GAMM|nr:hypothetical protein [Solemya velesiana gill symbiont]OOZ37521.1 hypothetical protein BOW51_01975 [Solemya velesiana gill symbiont]
MKRIIAVAMITLAAVGLSQPVSAGKYAHHGHFKNLANHQKMEIREGAKVGELTQREVQRLRKQQKRLKKRYQDYMADGRLSRYERRELKASYRNAESRIKRLRNNDEYRFLRVRISGLGKDSPFGRSRVGTWYPQDQRLVLR